MIMNILKKKKMTEKEALKFISDGLADFFKKEPSKITLWLMTNNPNFGDIAPCTLIMIGRAHKVAEFIKAAKWLNEKPCSLV